MKGIATFVLIFIAVFYFMKFLPYVAENFLDWFYAHSEPEQTEIEIQIVVSIVVLCVLILIFS